MASISSPSSTITIGYNGFELSGYFIQDYAMDMTGDMEAVVCDGRTLCYVTSNPGRSYKLSLVVGASANQDPPNKGDLITITLAGATGVPDEDGAATSATKLIVMESGVVRRTGAMLLNLTVQYHPAYADGTNATPMVFTGTTHPLT